jgi:hypothetical protein
VSKLTLPRSVSKVPRPWVMPRRPGPQCASARAGYKGRSVGTLVPKITQKVFEKFGFSTATLLTDWSIIVGRELANCTAPERLKWARGPESLGTASDNTQGRPGATLMLRVEPARALDIQYKSRLLIDRINAYFGYRAVAEIRLIQAPLLRQPGAIEREAIRVPSAAPTAAVAAVTDDDLREALICLEASIVAKRAARHA